MVWPCVKDLHHSAMIWRWRHMARKAWDRQRSMNHVFFAFKHVLVKRVHLAEQLDDDMTSSLW
eukprot:5783495-Karenia_brevis.AAC.1